MTDDLHPLDELADLQPRLDAATDDVEVLRARRRELLVAAYRAGSDPAELARIVGLKTWTIRKQMWPDTEGRVPPDDQAAHDEAKAAARAA